MTKDIWINLPVKDIHKSKDFFTKLGFQFNTRYSSEHSAALIVGEKNVVVMLFQENVFASFIRHNISDAAKATEVLFSIDAQSREEVDELAKKVTVAGGTIFAEPGENQGWMYGCGFTDPDGHRWNALYMDFEKMPKENNP